MSEEKEEFFDAEEGEAPSMAGVAMISRRLERRIEDIGEDVAEMMSRAPLQPWISMVPQMVPGFSVLAKVIECDDKDHQASLVKTATTVFLRQASDHPPIPPSYTCCCCCCLTSLCFSYRSSAAGVGDAGNPI